MTGLSIERNYYGRMASRAVILRLFGWKIGLGFWTGRRRHLRITTLRRGMWHMWGSDRWCDWPSPHGAAGFNLDFAHRLTIAAVQEAA